MKSCYIYLVTLPESWLERPNISFQVTLKLRFYYAKKQGAKLYNSVKQSPVAITKKVVIE